MLRRDFFRALLAALFTLCGGLFNWRKLQAKPKHQIKFERIITPRFTKDVHEMRTWTMDIRQVLSDNCIHDGVDVAALRRHAEEVEHVMSLDKLRQELLLAGDMDAENIERYLQIQHIDWCNDRDNWAVRAAPRHTTAAEFQRILNEVQPGRVQDPGLCEALAVASQHGLHPMYLGSPKRTLVESEHRVAPGYERHLLFYGNQRYLGLILPLTFVLEDRLGLGFDLSWEATPSFPQYWAKSPNTFPPNNKPNQLMVLDYKTTI